MKRNNNFINSLKDRFSFYANSVELKHKLIPIYSTSTLIFLFIFIFGPSPTAGDTITNFSAGSLIADWKLDALRTPLYPIILNLFKWLFHINFAVKLATIALQYIIFCISIFCFYRICEYLIKSKSVALLIVITYSCHPAILVWQKIIMTESFALSGVVFFLYFIIQFLRTKKAVYSFMINLFLFLLVMLRPAFVYLIPIVLIFWLYFIFNRKKNGWFGLGLNSFVIIIIIGYCFNFKNQYGVFSMSSVSDINQYMMLRDAGLIETGNIQNIYLKKNVTGFIQKKKTNSDYFDEYVFLYSKYGYLNCNKFVRESIIANLYNYLTYTEFRFINQSFASFVGFWSDFNYNKYNHLIKFVCCPFVILYLFLIFYPFVFIKKRTLYKTSILIYTITISSIFVIITGAPNSWGRLIVPTIPILLIMFGQSLDLISIIIKRKIITNI